MPLVVGVVLSVGISLTNVPERSSGEGPVQWTDRAQKGAAATPTEKQRKIAGRSSRLRFRIGRPLHPFPRSSRSSLLVSLSFFLPCVFLLPALALMQMRKGYTLNIARRYCATCNNNGRSRPCAKAEEGEKQMCPTVLSSS